MIAHFGPKLLEQLATGELPISVVRMALQTALQERPADVGDLYGTLRDALATGVIPKEAFQALAQQIEQHHGLSQGTPAGNASGTILRAPTSPDAHPSGEGTILRGVTELRGKGVSHADLNPPMHSQATMLRGAKAILPDPLGHSQAGVAWGDSSSPASVEIDAGVVIRGRYELEARLGSGGMGQVWKAKDLLLEQARDPRPYVAIKLLNSDFEQHPDAFVALQREAAKAQDLAHPNIATVHTFDLDHESGQAFICMELLTGQTLDEVIADHPGGLEPRTAVRIIRQLAAGLAHAHKKGIVHCDFKPGNAFLTDENSAKILDFGIARVVKGSARSDEVFDAAVLGALTPPYATLELSKGEEPHASDDVYALGLVAFELLTGVHPYGRRSAEEVLADNPRLPNLGGLKRREARAIHRAAALDRNVRWPDARAFLSAMEGPHPLILPLAGIAVTLALAAGYSTYQYFLESLPQVPFDQLPSRMQLEFRDAMTLGDDAYGFAATAAHQHEALQVILGDALSQYALAYTIHPKNREAHAALERAISHVTGLAKSMDHDDREQVRQVLEKLRADYPVLAEFPTLQKAIGALR